MIELELLGVEPNGERLSFNDTDGNRYSLAITDELRAALRKDVPTPTSQPVPISPREIQAMFRAGKTIDDVAQLCAMPATQLLALERPITAERQYTASQARGYRQAHELGGLTIDELVTSRLIDRGVAPSAITWDAYREAGAPWTLSATYTAQDSPHSALWRVNTKSQSIVALNDEAAWLTETQVPAPSSPWRAPNTPKVDPASISTFPSAPTYPVQASAFPRGLDIPESAQPSTDSDSTIDIDSVLATLDSQRGKSRPMPIDDDIDDIDTDAHAEIDPCEDENASKATPHNTAQENESYSRASDTDADEEAVLLAFPNQPQLPVFHSSSDQSDEEKSSASTPARKLTIAENTKSPNTNEEDKAPSPESPSKPSSKTRRSRPTMPSWDEIVFGYSKDADN